MKNILFIITIAFISVNSFSQTIKSVKDKKGLVTEATGLEIDQEYFAVDTETNKRTALVKVTQVKNDRAIVEIVKGKMSAGQKLVERKKTTAKKTKNQNSSKPADAKSISSNWKGVMLGFTQSTMAFTAQDTAATPATSADVSLKGSSIHLRGFYDYTFNNLFFGRFGVGYESIAVKGPAIATSSGASVCNNGSAAADCSVAFSYVTGNAMGYLSLNFDSSRLYFGLGYNFMIQVGSTNNVPNLKSNSSTNQMILYGLGYDIRVGQKGIVPIEYTMGTIPGSTVKTSVSYLRAGYGWDF